LCLFMQTLLNAKGQPVIVGIGRSLLTTVHLGTTVNVKNWSIFAEIVGGLRFSGITLRSA
jgi:hypothetical protein